MEIKLHDILQTKEDGETWVSYMAPEEFHFWTMGTGWDTKKFRKYDTGLVSMYVIGHLEVPGTKTVQRFKANEPLFLDCGVDIRKGYEQVVQTKQAGYEIRVDSCFEANHVMSELTQRTGITTWKVQRLVVHNNKSGAFCTFKSHNPDTTGTRLFFYRSEYDGTEELYPNILMSTQEYYLGKFKQHFAYCECSEKLRKFHGCAIKKRKTKDLNVS